MHNLFHFFLTFSHRNICREVYQNVPQFICYFSSTIFASYICCHIWLFFLSDYNLGEINQFQWWWLSRLKLKILGLC